MAAPAANAVDKTSVAQDANKHFCAGDYDQALGCLTQLSQQGEAADDPRLQHNLALTNFAKEGFTDAAGFMRQLGEIRDSLARRSNPSAGAAGSGAAGDAAGAAGGAASLPVDDDEDFREADTPALLYNQAAMQFQAAQFASAAATLYSVFSNIEPVDEGVSAHVCFLLLDVLLHACRGNLHSEADRAQLQFEAQRIFSFLEKLLEKLEKAASQTTSTPDAASEASPEAAAAAAAAVADTPHLTEFRFRMHLAKGKVFLAQGNAKAAKKEVKSALEIAEDRKRSVEKVPQAMAQGKLKGIQGACHPQPLEQPVQKLAGVYLQANLEYLRENYSKAMNYISKANTVGVTYPRCKARLQSLYFNNMGCVHFRMQRYRSAATYFTKSLRALKPAAARNAVAVQAPVEGSLVVTHNDCEILYNCGIQLLLMGRPEPAFGCFSSAARLFHMRPCLWLRLGECCIRVHAMRQRAKNTLVRRVVGTGVRRRLLLPLSGLSSPDLAAAAAGGGMDDEDPEGDSLPDLDAAAAPSAAASPAHPPSAPQPTLSYAVVCFRNLLALLAKPAGVQMGTPSLGATLSQLQQAQAQQQSAALGQTPSSAPQAARQAPQADKPQGSDGSGDANAGKLRQAALMNIAYASLCMANPVVALSAAQQLIELKDCAGAQRYIGRCYCAEALCLLSRPQEALEYLQPLAGEQQLGEHAAAAALAAARSGSVGGAPQSQQQISAHARCAMLVNLATAHVLQVSCRALCAPAWRPRAYVADTPSHNSSLLCPVRAGRSGRGREVRPARYGCVPHLACCCAAHCVHPAPEGRHRPSCPNVEGAPRHAPHLSKLSAFPHTNVQGSDAIRRLWGTLPTSSAADWTRRL